MLGLHEELVENFMKAQPVKFFSMGLSWNTPAINNQADEELEPTNNPAK
jgi:hypothetical protein